MNFSELTQTWAEQRGVPLHFTLQTGSTNDDAKAAKAEDDFLLFLSSHQTAGRGRGAHHWLDTGAGESLLSTWSWRVHSAPQSITGPRTGLALFLAAQKAWPGLKFGLKAPNDLYLDGRKVAGLLIESISTGSDHRMIVGLGLNISNHPRRFAEATHLGQALQRAPDEAEWFHFLDEWNRQLQTAVSECAQSELSAAVCQELKQALNANPARAFLVERVSPQGDLHHAHGVKKWSEL